MSDKDIDKKFKALNDRLDRIEAAMSTLDALGLESSASDAVDGLLLSSAFEFARTWQHSVSNLARIDGIANTMMAVSSMALLDRYATGGFVGTGTKDEALALRSIREITSGEPVVS